MPEAGFSEFPVTNHRLSPASAAGLATGFLSLDPTHLEVLRRSGSDLQRRTALRLQALLSRHNLVLFSIVLLHAIADEALPLVLERAFNEYVAVALSVPLVLLFGEVLPSAGRMMPRPPSPCRAPPQTMRYPDAPALQFSRARPRVMV